MNEIELLRAVNREFGLPAEDSGREPLVQTLNAFLIEQMNQGANVVLVLDEAQNLSVPVLEQIRMLSNLETDHRKLIQIILVGQPELARTLAPAGPGPVEPEGDRPLPPEPPRPGRHHALHPPSPERGRPAQPGAFQPQKPCAWSTGTPNGVPRRINALCDRALLAAYAQGSLHVERPISAGPGRKLPGRTQHRARPAWKD